MKLSLMLEADRINVQALNMGQIVVDVDGVNLTELINMVAENGYSLRVVEESDQQSTCTLPPFATLAGIRCSNRARYLNQELIVLVRCRKPVIFRVGICVGIGWCCLLLTILNHEVKSHV